MFSCDQHSFGISQYSIINLLAFWTNSNVVSRFQNFSVMDLVILLLAGRTANSYGMASAAGLTEPGNHKWKVMQVVSPIYSKGIKPEAYVFGNFILSYSPIKFTYQPLVLNR